MRRRRSALLPWGGAILGVVALGLIGGWLFLRASLPRLDGTLALEGLDAPVSIERDARGMPTVRAQSRADLAFATGYLHAQDRYFQMDLLRRLPAGELAEMFGPPAIAQDRRARPFRFRKVAEAVLGAATPAERELLLAYTRGVNAGLGALGSRPWEYWVLRQVPAPWRPEDSVLTAFAMWWQLQYLELDRARVRNAVRRAIVAQGSKDPEAALRFLYPRGTSWDAPDASHGDNGALRGDEGVPPQDPPVPPPEVLDLRLRTAPVGVQIMTGRKAPPTPAADAMTALEQRGGAAGTRGAGSNNWALAGALTADGGALVASDMHLALAVPPTWYPARLIVASANSAAPAAAGAGTALDLGGLTLPGTPVLIAGSNGALAWSYTNSYGDWLDVTRMSCPSAGGLLRPDGVHEPLSRVSETIAVRAAAPVRLEFEVASSGIRLPGGGVQSECDIVAWLAAAPAATNLRLLELERARSTAEALALAPEIGIPHQNLVVGDASGHIAWSVVGRIPDDTGVPAFLRNTGTLPWRTASTQPRLADPPEGRLWTANARVVGGTDEAILGGDEAALGAGYDLGARARQIRDDLRQLGHPATPGDMLRIQLDDRALFLARWRQHLLELLDARATGGHFERAEFRRLIEVETPRAAPGSVSYRLVRSFHVILEQRTWQLILTALDARDADGNPLTGAPPPQFEGTLWPLVTLRPAHLLPVAAASWRAFELEALDATLDELARGCRTLASCGYESNRPVAIRHPLAASLPDLIAPLIDMAVIRLPGDHDMPRVQDGAFGASERFAVEPGHEAEGYLELPGGQSGHPLSPYYRSGFADWAAGRPVPFRPGTTEHRLELIPARLPATR